MATTYELIDSVTLGSDTASVTFSSIPGTYDDLVLLASSRTTSSGASTYRLGARFNSATTNYSYRRLYGDGNGGTGSDASTALSDLLLGYIATGAQTANTFASTEVVIPNYAGAVAKSVSSVSLNENNAANAYTSVVAGLWNSTSAITSITLLPESGNLATNSSFYLYGITKA